jgi:hypothetical protein
LSFEIEVAGEGRLDEVNYFGGYYSGQPRWGSGFFWSGQRFLRGFNPEPSSDERWLFGPGEGSGINLTGVPLPGRADWFFTPPPFCFAFEVAGRWLGLGVEAEAGEHQYTQLRYHGQHGSFYLSLAFEGYAAVQGRYRLPAIDLTIGTDPYTTLALHAASAPNADAVRQPRAASPAWWREPIFCGWGAQCHLAAQRGGRAPDMARQEHYVRFLATLRDNGVDPGIIVLDDKWQATYGDNDVDQEKWPDLPAFIREQHAAGRHVLLWLKAWDPQGVPEDECITNAAGAPLAVDPTNPAYRRRLRASIERMLGPSGYDADGFKLDFTARIPSGPGLRQHGRAWGLELMRAFLDELYTGAKTVKPDALVMTHTPHPYLAESLDMIRLNDVNTGQPVNPAMRHRARVARAACPQALIDTDNWPMPNRAAWRDYVALQPELGIPSLYFATHIDSTGEPLEPEDYALIRAAWARHRAQGAAGAPP